MITPLQLARLEEAIMSQTLELSEEEYARLEQVAREQGNTISALVQAWISSMGQTPSEQRIHEAQAR